jgi:uncharacterized membrane protein YfcA
MPQETFSILIVMLVCLIIGLSKGGLSPSLGVVCAPLLASVMPVRQALSLTLPLLIIGDIFALISYWNTWTMRYIWILLPPAIVGALVGAYVLASLPDEAVRQLIGVIIIAFVIYKMIEPQLPLLQYRTKPWHGWAAGAAAGVGSMVANVGGPPFTIYMLLQSGVSPVSFNGTATLFFAIVNVLKLPFLSAATIFDIQDLLTHLWAVPLIPLGVLMGHYLVKRVNRQTFDIMMLITLTISALVLLFVPPTQ